MRFKRLIPQIINPKIILIVLSPALTELCCGNMPPRLFFIPFIFLFSLIAYGFPALLIRDLCLRWKMGIPGMFVLGLAYGFYNEGICAKTLMMVHDVPINTFDGYSFFGINWAWGLFILPWHALYSMVFPITIVNYLFPEQRYKILLSKKHRLILLAFVVIAGFGGFLNTKKVEPNFAYLLFFVAVITMLTLFSKRMPRTLIKLPYTACRKTGPFISGVLFYIAFFFGMALLSRAHWHEFMLLVYLVVLSGFCCVWLKKRGWFSCPALVIFALGNYFSIALLSILHAVTNGLTDLLISGFIFLTVFLVSVWRIKAEDLEPNACGSV